MPAARSRLHLARPFESADLEGSGSGDPRDGLPSMPSGFGPWIARFIWTAGRIRRPTLAISGRVSPLENGMATC